MLTRKFLYIACALLAFSTASLAQEDYDQSAVDNDWIASQNGGSTSMDDGQSEEPQAACIGDGCDGTEVAAPVENASQNSQSESSESSSTNENANVSPAPCEGDSCKDQVASVANQAPSEDEYEDCTEADSTNVECVEVAEVEDKSNTYDRYIQENAEEYRARKEGFSRAIQLGARVTGGMDTFFGKKSSPWNFGYMLGGGLMLKMPLGIRGMDLVPEVNFVYRHYDYENRTDISKDNAEINSMLFEIPLVFRYLLDDLNMYVGIGLDMSLKLTDNTMYTQKFDDGSKVKDDAALVTSSVEVGGVIDIGYFIMSDLIVDIRAVQNFTNTLNTDLVPPGKFKKANLLTFHTSVGVGYFF